MYKVRLETPKGILFFEIEKIQEIGNILLQHPDYTGVSAKQYKEENEKVKKLTRKGR